MKREFLKLQEKEDKLVAIDTVTKELPSKSLVESRVNDIDSKLQHKQSAEGLGANEKVSKTIFSKWF